MHSLHRITTVILLSIGAFLLGFGHVAQADQTTTTYQHVKYEHLTDVQQSKLVRDTPKERATLDNEAYTLVYSEEGSGTGSATGTNGANGTNAGNGNGGTHSAVVLPQAFKEKLADSNTSAANKQQSSATDLLPLTSHEVTVALVIIGSTGLIAFGWWRYRKTTKTLLVMVVSLGGLAALTNDAEAATNSNHLHPEITRTFEKGDPMHHDPVDVDGHEYLGYVHETASTEPIPEPEVPESKGTVTVNYVDENGAELDKVVLKDDIGKEYKTEQKSFDGYEFVESKGKTEGIFSASEETVTYKYKRTSEQKTATITVNYLDIDNMGSPLDTELIDVPIGEYYEISHKDFADYQYLGSDGDTQGIASEEGATITFYYSYAPEQRNATVTVKYVDADDINNVLHTYSFDKPVGSYYETEQKSFNGYDFVGSDNATGIVSEDGNTATYSYRRTPEPVKGTLTIHHVSALHPHKVLRTDKITRDVGVTETFGHDHFSGYWLPWPLSQTVTFTDKPQTITFYYVPWRPESGGEEPIPTSEAQIPETPQATTKENSNQETTE